MGTLGAGQPRPKRNAKVESQQWGTAYFGCAAEPASHEYPLYGGPISFQSKATRGELGQIFVDKQAPIIYSTNMIKALISWWRELLTVDPN